MPLAESPGAGRAQQTRRRWRGGQEAAQVGRASSVSALRGARLGTATLQHSLHPAIRHPQRPGRLIPNALLSGFTHQSTHRQEIAVQSSRFTGVKQASDRAGFVTQNRIPVAVESGPSPRLVVCPGGHGGAAALSCSDTCLPS